jgi:hypothetical protein
MINEDKGEGLADKAKQKGEELLDKVSGPDVPPHILLEGDRVHVPEHGAAAG